jgi:CheY-like chemotaxis protein
MSSPTILLVEDNREDVLFFRYALTKAGFAWNLRVAEDGQKAVDQLSRSATSALSHVLLDLKLPIKSGLEVLEWIRKHPALAQTPVIVLTSSDVPSDVERARALGVDAYLIKPLTTNGLVETIRTIAERWKLSPSR